MDKAKELKSTTELVKHILETVPAARNSDTLLYYRICEHIDYKVLDLSAGYFLLARKDYGIPGFETVRRTRQQIQRKHPELAGDKVKEKRKENEQIFREFARSEV